MAKPSAPTDLLTIDRKIALAARALDGWRGELPVEDSTDDDDVIATWKELASKSTIESIHKSGLGEIATIPALLLPTMEAPVAAAIAIDDPLATLRPAIVSWCTHLLIARTIRAATSGRAAIMRDEQESEAYGRETSIRAMLRALARPRQASGVPEPRAQSTLEELAPKLMDGVVDEEMQRREAAEGLGAAGKCCAVIDATIAKEAEAFLARTDDEAEERIEHGLRAVGRQKKGATWVDLLAVRRAADVAEGWPSALTPRWIAELARGTELLAGLNLDVRVDAGRLAPRADHACLRLAPPTGAWTFARALQALGVALRLHGREPRVPFASYALPHDRRPYVFGEAFHALSIAPVFHARARGISRPKAEASARRLATTRLLERRALALRVRLALALEEGRRSFLDAFEALAPRALGGDVPRSLASILGAPGPLGPAEDAARFKAFEDGDRLAEALVSRFDDDWWRNPQAASWIRDRCANGS